MAGDEVVMCACGCGLSKEAVIQTMMQLREWTRAQAEGAYDVMTQLERKKRAKS